MHPRPNQAAVAVLEDLEEPGRFDRGAAFRSFSADPQRHEDMVLAHRLTRIQIEAKAAKAVAPGLKELQHLVDAAIVVASGN